MDYGVALLHWSLHLNSVGPQMTGNQSGTEKDNTLLFKEQFIVVLEIQDGRHKFQSIRS